MQLAIASYQPDGRKACSPAEDELLGTMSDKKLARRLKQTVEAIKSSRARLRIPALKAA